jgi:DNA-binding NarL/FixJ family response regulator
MVRILLVDDHPLVRSGLRAEIEVHEGMQVVAEAGTAAEALERLAVERPHVAVIDVRLGDECGIDLGRRIVAQSPCATVLLTAFDWDVYLVRAWEAGAAAFVTKSDDTTALVEAIRGAADGARVFSAEQRTRIDAWQRNIAAPLALLSERESAVLRLMVEGATNREIAVELGLAVKTVEAHVHSILRKLRQPSRRAALVWARRHRITEYAPSKTPLHRRFPW